MVNTYQPRSSLHCSVSDATKYTRGSPGYQLCHKYDVEQTIQYISTFTKWVTILAN